MTDQLNTTYLKNLNTKKTKFLITIAGPTAVGKTSTTISLAQRYDASVFSADSRQLYREMSIGTAKPTSEELEAAPHHFIDHISLTEPYNAGQYERDFDKKIQEYFLENDVAILSGGTGMYINAALNGLDNFPPVSQEVKRHFAQIMETNGIEELQRLLRQQDPDYAMNVDLENPRRIARALEVMAAGDRTYTAYLDQRTTKQHDFQVLKICLTRPREELYDRINQRVDMMIKQGLVAEVRSLTPMQSYSSMDTVGYREIFQYLDGEISLERAIELIKRNSRRYAKRQMTWFRNQGEWIMVEADDYDAIIEHIEEWIGSCGE